MTSDYSKFMIKLIKMKINNNQSSNINIEGKNIDKDYNNLSKENKEETQFSNRSVFVI